MNKPSKNEIVDALLATGLSLGYIDDIAQALDDAEKYRAMIEAGPVRYETFNGTTWIKSLHNVGGELLERALYALPKEPT